MSASRKIGIKSQDCLIGDDRVGNTLRGSGGHRSLERHHLDRLGELQLTGPGGVPTTTSAVVIGNSTTNNPVQLNSNVSLNGTTEALTVGAGFAPGTASVLNINSGDTLTMGTRPVTLATVGPSPALAP